MSGGPITTARIAVVVAVVLAQVVCGAATLWAETSSPSLTVSLERSFGPGWLQAIVVLPAGGYAVAGRRGPLAKGNFKVDLKASVIRLDERGDIVWERTLVGKRPILIGGLSLMPSGQFALVGVTGEGDDWVLTLDPSGKVLSEKSFSGPHVIDSGSTVILPSGGWVTVGDDLGTLSQARRILFRFGCDGIFLSKQALPNPDDGPTLITPVGSSAFAVAWIAPTDGGAKGRPRIIRYDAATLEPTWDTTIDLDPELEPSVLTMAPLTGGALGISGMIGAYGRGATWWAAVIGPDGRTQWLSRIGRFDFAVPFGLAGLADGGVVIGGCAISDGAKLPMPWLAILDAKGNLTSESVVPMQDGGTVLALASLPTGEFAAAGISGNGCAYLDAGLHGVNTWVRVMRPAQINQPR